MLTIIKAHLRSKGLNEVYEGGISSFTLTLMVVSYLQHCEEESCFLSVHLIRFLRIFGEKFDYHAFGISIRAGGFYFLREDKDRSFDDGFLCVENPLDPEINIGCQTREFRLIKEEWGNASMKFQIDYKALPTESLLA